MKLQDFPAWLVEHLFLAQILISFLLALIVDLIQRKAFKKISTRLKKTDSYWDDAVAKAVVKPLTFVLWLSATFFSISTLQKYYGVDIIPGLDIFRSIAITVAITWFFFLCVHNTEKNFLSKGLKKKGAQGRHMDPTTALAVSKVLKVCVFACALLVMLPIFGYSISGLLAFGGAGALMVSLAAKDLLSNFFGGLMIYLDRPFAIGDWVRSPDQNIEGTVEHIGWRVTRIRTFDKRPLYVPNSVFVRISVENPQRMWNRRIKETIGVRYRDVSKVANLTDKIRSLLANHPDIDTNQTLIVNLLAFGPSSLDILIYTFTKTTVWVDFHVIKEKVLLQIAKIIEDEGCEIAFPTSTLHIGDKEEREKIMVVPPPEK